MAESGDGRDTGDHVIIELASTTAHKIAKRMVDLRESHGAIALGRVLTLVLVVDEASAEPGSTARGRDAVLISEVAFGSPG